MTSIQWLCLYVVAAVFSTAFAARYDPDGVRVMCEHHDGSKNVVGQAMLNLFGFAWYMPFMFFHFLAWVLDPVIFAILSVDPYRFEKESPYEN